MSTVVSRCTTRRRRRRSCPVSANTMSTAALYILSGGREHGRLEAYLKEKHRIRRGGAQSDGKKRRSGRGRHQHLAVQCRGHDLRRASDGLSSLRIVKQSRKGLLGADSVREGAGTAVVGKNIIKYLSSGATATNPHRFGSCTDGSLHCSPAFTASTPRTEQGSRLYRRVWN